MDRQNPFPDDSNFDVTLRQAVEAVRAEPVPGEATRRVVQRAKQLAPRPLKTRWTRRLQIASGVAALLLVSTFLLQASSPDALAQVAAAVSKQPWLHAVGKTPDGRPVERWYSAQQGILALKVGDEMTFVDHRLGIMEIYRGDGKIYRLPIRDIGHRGTAGDRQQLEAMLSGDLEQAFLAPAQRVVSHEKREIQADGEKVLEHRFVVHLVDDGDADDSATESILQVDPETHLPFRWEERKKRGAIEFAVSYPDRGPETIAALGVPESTTLVNKVPRGDLRRILAAVRTTPSRFDNYRAVVIQAASSDPREDGYVHYQVWRKGRKWRIEQLRVQPYGEVRIPEGMEPEEWWLRNAKTWKSYPVAISDGEAEWLFDAVPAVPRRPDPDNPDYLLIQSMRKEKKPFQSPFDPKDPRPHEHERLMPEFYGYPSPWRATAADFQTSVDSNPKQGPDGTVLVEIRKAGDASGISGFRYWTDPERSHLVVRREWLSGTKEGGQLEGANEIVEAARSPKGYWYPTVVRVPNGSVRKRTEDRSDYYFRYYLEFGVEIPDSLFDPSNARAP